MADDTSNNAKSNDSGDQGKTDDSKNVIPGQRPAKEIGGRDGPDPTRYGDWEKAGRCIDF